jgi:hypothetical protein
MVLVKESFLLMVQESMVLVKESFLLMVQE